MKMILRQIYTKLLVNRLKVSRINQTWKTRTGSARYPYLLIWFTKKSRIVFIRRMDLVILCLYYPYKATRQWMVKWRNQFWFTRSCGILNSNANKLSRDKELENTKKMVHTDLLALYFNIQDSHWNKALFICYMFLQLLYFILH